MLAVLLSVHSPWPSYLFVGVDLERPLAVDQLVRLDLTFIEQPYALLSHRSREISQAVSSTAPQVRLINLMQLEGKSAYLAHTRAVLVPADLDVAVVMLRDAAARPCILHPIALPEREHT